MRIRFLSVPKANQFEYTPRYSKDEKLLTEETVRLEKGAFRKYARTFSRFTHENQDHRARAGAVRILSFVLAILAVAVVYLVFEDSILPLFLD